MSGPPPPWRRWQDAAVPLRRPRLFASTSAALALAGLAGLLGVGCGGDDAGATAPTSARRELEGPTWLLDVGQLGVDGVSGAGGAGDDGLDEVLPTIRFLEGQVGGRAGCNSFRGTYRLDGSELTLSPLAATLIGCPPPLDEVERRILDRLARVTRYEIQGDRLTLLAGREILLRYDVSEPAIEGAWVATGVLYDDGFRSIVGGAELTADFGTEGSLTGSGGCNRFRAGYTVSGGDLAVGPVASTKIACPTEELARQELGYFEALASAARWDQVGRELTITNAAGQRAASFRRA